MSSRKHQPEMFEAFKRAEEAKKEQGTPERVEKPQSKGGSGQVSPRSVAPVPRSEVPPKPEPTTAPVRPEPTDKPVQSKTPSTEEKGLPRPVIVKSATMTRATGGVAKSETDVKRSEAPAPSVGTRTERSWMTGTKGQGKHEPTHVALGQRRDVVLAMSYGWATGLTAGVVGLLVVAALLGRMSAPTGDWPTDTGQPSGNLPPSISPAPVSSPNAPPALAPGAGYSVQVVSPRANAAGAQQLIKEMQDFLTQQGYGDFRTVRNGEFLELRVGNYITQHEAEVARDRIKVLRSKFKFDTAFVRPPGR